MATYAKILKDASGNQILPYTRAKLVYTDGNDTVQNAIATVQTVANAKASTSAFGRVQVGSNITVSNGVISSTKGNVTSALGYTPANINTAKYLYHANLPVASWVSASSDTKYTGFAYYMGVGFTADNDGTANLTSYKIGTPMTIKTNSSTTNETLQANLNIIAAGLIVCESSGSIKVFVKKKPSSDITIYFEAQAS